MKNLFKIACIFFLLTSVSFSAQEKTDSIAYNKDFVLNEGIYLNYYDFRTNRPISKEVIRSQDNKDQLEFLSKLVDNNTFINFNFNGIEHKVHADSIWGYCQNNVVYINYEHKFCRIPLFGNLSQFIAMVEVTNYMNNFGPYYSYGMTAASMPVKSVEVKQYILDFYSGKIVSLDLKNTEILLERDPTIYKEFMLLKKKQRKDKMSLYIRKYNEKHPIQFPTN